jgi:hypothetical protein
LEHLECEIAGAICGAAQATAEEVAGMAAELQRLVGRLTC